MRDGRVVADPERDLAKLAVIERHHATGRVGVGLVRGFGLRSRRVRLDGRPRRAQHRRRRRRRREHGRLRASGWPSSAAASRSPTAETVRGELALPVAGLLSEEPAEAVVARLDELVALLREQGVAVEAPFMTLSFLALSVIPDLKLTDRGLVDVVGARVVPLAVQT